MFVFLFDYAVLHPSKASLLLCPIITQLSAQILQFFLVCSKDVVGTCATKAIEHQLYMLLNILKDL